MTTNKKPPVPYAARLARESVKFGLRLVGVLGGVAAAGLWEATKQLPTRSLGLETDDSGNIFRVERADIQSNSLDEAASLGQPLYYDRFSDDREEQGIWAK